MTGMGLSEVMPFLSLYIEELGNFNKSALTLYSSLIFSVTFLVMALVSPLWGRLADRKGRKLMLLRASFGMAVVFFLMAFVTNVWQLMLLRALQGAFGGFISNANALIAVQSPKNHAGQALSVLVTGSTAGTLLGPLLGGILASVFGYRFSFHITGMIMFIVFLLTFFLVKEDVSTFRLEKNKQVTEQPTKTLQTVIQNRFVFFLLLTTLSVQVVNLAINPILSLFVKELLPAGNVTLMAGFVAAMPGISTIIAAPTFGKLGDRFGTTNILFFGFSFACVIFFLTGFVHNIVGLMILRFLTGISDAALIPSIQTMLTKETPQAETSLIFSYNQSFQSIGSVMGPLAGGVLASLFDYNGIFFFSSILMMLNLAGYFLVKKQQT
jgi:DHA1 family multidrug resistance protein-like MFS transporter